MTNQVGVVGPGRRPQPAPAPIPRPGKRKPLPTWLALVIGFGVAIVIAITAFFLYQSIIKSQSSKNQTDSRRILREVGKIYLLPTGEEPTVARIQDVTKLAGQVFYKDARNGDYLVLYNKQKLAIIYREPQNQVIIAAPVANASDASAGPSTQR